MSSPLVRPDLPPDESIPPQQFTGISSTPCSPGLEICQRLSSVSDPRTVLIIPKTLVDPEFDVDACALTYRCYVRSICVHPPHQLDVAKTFQLFQQYVNAGDWVVLHMPPFSTWREPLPDDAVTPEDEVDECEDQGLRATIGKRWNRLLREIGRYLFALTPDSSQPMRELFRLWISVDQVLDMQSRDVQRVFPALLLTFSLEALPEKHTQRPYSAKVVRHRAADPVLSEKSALREEKRRVTGRDSDSETDDENLSAGSLFRRCEELVSGRPLTGCRRTAHAPPLPSGTDDQPDDPSLDCASDPSDGQGVVMDGRRATRPPTAGQRKAADPFPSSSQVTNRPKTGVPSGVRSVCASVSRQDNGTVGGTQQDLLATRRMFEYALGASVQKLHGMMMCLYDRDRDVAEAELRNWEDRAQNLLADVLPQNCFDVTIPFSSVSIRDSLSSHDHRRVQFEAAQSHHTASMHHIREKQRATYPYPVFRAVYANVYPVTVDGYLPEALREAKAMQRILRSLQHPNLLTTFGFTSDMGTLFGIVREYAPKGSVRDLLARCRLQTSDHLTYKDLFAMLESLASVLLHCHTMKLRLGERNIDPSQLFCTEDPMCFKLRIHAHPTPCHDESDVAADLQLVGRFLYHVVTYGETYVTNHAAVEPRTCERPSHLPFDLWSCVIGPLLECSPTNLEQCPTVAQVLQCAVSRGAIDVFGKSAYLRLGNHSPIPLPR